MKVFIDHIEQEAPHILTFYLRPEDVVSYAAGQFVRLTIDHPNPDDRGIWRWFTLSSSPTDELLSITVKFVARNGSTFTDILRRASQGDEFEIGKPRGNFVLPEDTAIPLVFVAGGIGITPFRSMYRWLEVTGQKRKINLLYGVNEEQDIVFHSMLSNLGSNAIVSVNHSSDVWKGRRGLLTAEMILEVTQQWRESRIFISGPEMMVESLKEGLIEQGVNQASLALDAFPGFTSV